MSYSTFKYNNIVKSEQYKADDKAIQTTNEKFLGQKDGESLYDELLTVSVDVQNTGDIVACEVAQLYAQYPAGFEQPIKQLRGFDKAKQLAKGQSKTLTFPIRRKDVAIWDVVQQIWRIPAGEFTFHVGSSSRTLPLVS
jgi:beta-glucosidase